MSSETRPRGGALARLLATLLVTAAVAGPACGLDEHEWYIYLTVTAESLSDPGPNILGRFGAAVDGGPDLHDLPELPPTFTPYLTIVFPHPEWGSAWGYSSDYREPRPGAGGEWRFEVRSDTLVEVTLEWSTPVAAMLGRSVLVDEADGQEIAITPGGSFTRTLASTAHSFLWRVNSLPQVDLGGELVPDDLGHLELLPATFTDEESDDEHTATVDWGDGTVESATVDDLAGTVWASHDYAGQGLYPVTVCVTDQKGGEGCASTDADWGYVFADGFEDGITDAWVTAPP